MASWAHDLLGGDLIEAGLEDLSHAAGDTWLVSLERVGGSNGRCRSGAMIMSVRRLFALAVVTLASCSEDVLGSLNNTVDVLRSVDGGSLPATVVDALGGLAWVVTADTIWFESGSRWRRHSVQHREPGVGGEPLDLDASGTVVRRQDGLLILAFECDDTDCIAPDRFVQTKTGLEMGGTYLHAGTNLVFQPI